MAANKNDNNNVILPNKMNVMYCHKSKVNSAMNVNTTELFEAILNSENSGKRQKNQNQPIDSVSLVAPQSIASHYEKFEINASDENILKTKQLQFPARNGYEMDLSEYLESTESIPVTNRRISLPSGFRQQRKRKRFSFLGATDKRRFSVSGAALTVCSSFLDCIANSNSKRESKSNIFINLLFKRLNKYLYITLLLFLSFSCRIQFAEWRTKK